MLILARFPVSLRIECSWLFGINYGTNTFSILMDLKKKEDISYQHGGVQSGIKQFTAADQARQLVMGQDALRNPA